MSLLVENCLQNPRSVSGIFRGSSCRGHVNVSMSLAYAVSIQVQARNVAWARPRAPSSYCQRESLVVPHARSVSGDGRTRRERLVVRRRDQVHIELLTQFARRAVINPSVLNKFQVTDTFRFPTQEFRSLALNIVGKLVPVDRGLWKQYKVQLCSLLLHFLDEEASCAASLPQPASPDASTDSMHWQAPAADAAIHSMDTTSGHGASLPGSDSRSDSDQPTQLKAGPFSQALEELLDLSFQRDRQHLLKLLADDRISDDQKGSARGRWEARRRMMTQHVTSWCQDTANHPDFAVMKPFLKQVLEIEPVPLFEQSGRDGSKTEDLMYELIERELPMGWSLYSGARLLKVDDEPFPNQKFLKGEADLLLTDPDGMVQALLEVKTASGNLFLALYEDVVRFLALMDRVRGHSVTFSLSDSSRMTLEFSPHLHPVYVLGCELHPDDLEALALSAQYKLMAMEVGRMLSSQVSAWGCMQVLDLNPAAVKLQVSQDCLPQLQDNVHRYFETLAACEIYTLQQSAWSQRATLEADARMNPEQVLSTETVAVKQMS